MNTKNIIKTVVGATFVLLIIMAFLPKPVEVELARATRGELLVTVDEDGETRIREKYVVSSPLTGQLLRIALDPGDSVVAGETVLAQIEPADPSLLDSRSRAQAEARVKAADAAAQRAQAAIEEAKARKQLTEREMVRQRILLESNNTSKQRFDDAEYQDRAASQGLRSAELALQIAEFELEQAEAALIHTNDDAGLRHEIRSPIDGKVLRVFQESSTPVSAGARLVELGDPTDLEIQIDVLSNDAVKIEPGTRVLLEHWGGEGQLEAEVRLVEPSAFTKISALGVEEQRVYVVADLTTPVEQRKSLGDGFRVEARIVVWEGEDVLKIPAGALFRSDGEWHVFVKRGSKAVLTKVELGEKNGLAAEIKSGLTVDDWVVSHPSDQVDDGTPIKARD
tara:strand:- start:1116 stop:2300 length:1185 start_codon:yes stop_codon:yes gene_type:complete